MSKNHMIMSEVKKSMYDISWKVTEPEYRKGNGLSYSTIARFHREGFDKLGSLFDRIDNPSLVFGSMVDTLITGSQEEFDSAFLVAEFPPVVDSQVNVIKYLFEKYSDEYQSILDIPDDSIIIATNILEFQSRWKSETRVKAIKENGIEYYNLLYLSIGKILVSTQEYKNAAECVKILKECSTTDFYFSPVNPFENNIEKLFQLKFKGTYEGIELRCMADEVIVNHDTKTATPIDLKTSFKQEWNFPESFIKWCYWIQAQLYWYIIRQNMDADPLYKDYDLENYKFIVISNGTRTPLIWDYPDTKASATCYYGKDNQIECKNWREIVKDLHYYLTINPNVPKGIKETNNIIDWIK